MPASPPALKLTGWGKVLRRVYRDSGEDNLGLIAAGVAYYGFLTLVPALGAVVMTYGLVSDPADVTRQMHGLVQHIPADAAKLIEEQLTSVVHTAASKKGLGLALALALALYGAMKGAAAIVTALNVAYEVPENRSFVKTTLINAAVTAGALVVALLALASASVLAALDTSAGSLSPVLTDVIKLASWLVTAAITITAVALLYRYAPARAEARWQWVTPGSILATGGFLVMTLAFSAYARYFGNYNATYGSLGAVVVLLLWLSLSAYVLLLGAELNAALEKNAR